MKRALTLTLFASLACCAPSFRIAAPSARHPISLSGVVYGPSREVLDDASLTQVAELSWRDNACAIEERADGRVVDLSNVLNESVESNGGEAVVDLRVSIEPPSADVSFTAAATRCATVLTTGRVVRRAPQTLALDEVRARCDAGSSLDCHEVIRRATELPPGVLDGAAHEDERATASR